MSEEKSKKTAPKVDFFADLKARAGNAQRLGINAVAEPEVGEKIEQLSLDAIMPNPNQPRRQLTPVEDQELADDIKERGILQPIIVRPAPDIPGKYQLVAGERRWRAAKIADLAQVPAIVKNYTDKEARAVAAIENLQRKDLAPLDEAQYFKFLAHEYNLSNKDIATFIHKSASYVDQRMRLIDENRVKNTQKLQDSQLLWKYRPKEWVKMQTAITQAKEGIATATHKDKANLKQHLQALRQELEALEKELA